MNKNKYIEFCRIEDEIPVFNQPWWLDIVCGRENWDVVYLERGGNIYAALPFLKTRRLFLDFLHMPPYTQYFSIWIRHNKKISDLNKVSAEYKIIEGLISLLPRYGHFSLSFHPQLINCLPFIWKGFKQRNYYTYIINDISDLDSVFKRFKSSTRGGIKKAEKLVFVEESDSVDVFCSINSDNLKSKGLSSIYTDGLMNDLIKTTLSKGKGKLLMASNNEGKLIGGGFFLEDCDMIHYLMGAVKYDFKNTDAMSLIIWEAIKLFSHSGKKFNFEGSMLKPIEKYFRSFGATLMPINHITKTNSFPVKLKEFLKS
jgi:hypothetical protein